MPNPDEPNTRPLTEAEQAFVSSLPVLTPGMIRDAYEVFADAKRLVNWLQGIHTTEDEE